MTACISGQDSWVGRSVDEIEEEMVDGIHRLPRIDISRGNR